MPAPTPPVATRPLGVGVVGCGRIARMIHLPVLRGLSSARLVAAVDPDPDVRAAAEREVPGTPVLPDLERLFEHPEVEAVVVCVPTHRHEEVAAAVLAAGLPVYVEKPLAPDVAAAERLVAAQQAAGVPAVVGFNFRFHPLIGRTRQLLEAGTLGELVAVRGLFASAPRDLPEWKRATATGGGALRDLATHHLDLVPHLLGTDVVAVEATTSSVRTTDDTVRLRLELADGPQVQLLATTSAAPADRLELHGDAGSWELDRMAQREPTWRPTDGPSAPADRLRAAVDAVRAGVRRAHDGLRPPSESSFAASLGAFCEAAALGAVPTQAATFEDGLRVARLVEAADRSAAGGGTVAVDGTTVDA